MLSASLAAELGGEAFLGLVFSKLEFEGVDEKMVEKLQQQPAFNEKVLTPILALKTSAA